MPRDKSSKRLDRKILDYKKRPYENALATASFFLDPDSARVSALTLRAWSDYDRAIKKAFDAFGLDSNKPDHWRRLLGILADVLFGERGKGPKLRWDSDSIKQLIFDFDHLSATLPKMSQMFRFEVLIGLKPKRYAGVRASTLKARYNEGKSRFGIGRPSRRAKAKARP
jgi:hypothetical protein